MKHKIVSLLPLGFVLAVNAASDYGVVTYSEESGVGVTPTNLLGPLLDDMISICGALTVFYLAVILFRMFFRWFSTAGLTGPDGKSEFGYTGEEDDVPF